MSSSRGYDFACFQTSYPLPTICDILMTKTFNFISILTNQMNEFITARVRRPKTHNNAYFAGKILEAIYSDNLYLFPPLKRSMLF
jgi:hypothetical protein